MAITKCRECQRPISTKAEACPGCGAVQRKTGCFGLIIATILGVFSFSVFAGLVVGDGHRSAPSARTSVSSPPPKQSQPPSPASDRGAFINGKMVVAAKRAVKRELRDPDSAQFQDISYADSEETGPAVFGHVNSKNAFGGYGGFVKFVSNGTITLIEGRDPKAVEAWQKLFFAAKTEATLVMLPRKLDSLFD